MKLKNKKTGEIIVFDKAWLADNDNTCMQVNSLAELNKYWEDYEEPRTFWANSWAGEAEEYDAKKTPQELQEMCKIIGNYFKTKEEAEKTVEKLKAWKRLKDKGFRFDCWDENHHNLGIAEFSFPSVENSVYEFQKDLDLLFSEEEE